jgi:DNA-directed RNA polymerase specialized sigma subunit
MTREQLDLIIEDPKTFLLQGQKAKELISAKRERIEEWRRLAESITAALKEDAVNGGGHKQSIVENAVCNIVDLENEILDEIRRLAAIERDIRSAIDLYVTDDRHRVVLEMRYLNGYSWRTIGARLYYGEDWVCRLHGAALRELRRKAELTVSSRSFLW